MSQVLIQQLPGIPAVTYKVFPDDAKEDDMLKKITAEAHNCRIVSVPDSCLGSAEQLLAAIDERTHK